MKCEKCQQERDDTDLYEFYFGKRGSTSVSYHTQNYMQSTTTTTSYTIAGQMQAMLCSKCVQNKRSSYWITFLVLIVLTLGLLCSFQGTLNIVSPSLRVVSCLLAGILFIVSITGMLKSFKIVGQPSTEIGDRLAISLHETKLRNDGHNAFFTRMQYSSLSPANRYKLQ